MRVLYVLSQNRMITTPSQTSSSLRLSKSKYLAGLQCHKRLYLEIHAPELASEPDPATRAILDMGTGVGELARERYPGGVLVACGPKQLGDALRQTQELLQTPGVPAIFEATFLYDQILVRADIVERVSQESAEPAWRLIEVKSSSRLKEPHIDDLAIQTYVLAGAGVRLAGSALMHINSQYVFPGGEIDLMQFFTVHDLTETVATKRPAVFARLEEMWAMLDRAFPPAVEPDGHCQQPYACPFWDHCTKEKPKRWIFYLPGNERISRELALQGIGTIDAIPDTVSLSIIQRRVKNNVEWIGPGLKAALRAVRYPVHHLDFETFMPAVPKFPATRPYQTIPTQWSNHVDAGLGEVKHDEFLAMEPKDAREDLTMALLESLGQEGSICVYSGFERAILQRLADVFPSLRVELARVIERLWDLLAVIREHYYHPAFEGSFSIKSVLPAVAPALAYGDLDIRDGGTAAREYHRMVFEEMDLVEKLRLREALLKYCERDTFAMLELRRVLADK